MQFGLCAAAGSGRCGARGFCLSNALGSHLVLQRSPQAAALWGFAPPGDDVTCRLGSSEARAVADASGDWALTLPPQPAGGPHDLVCSSRLRSDAAETLRDVLFGDVFLCGGQSNMVFVTSASFNGTEEVAAADAFPNIRLFSVGQFTARPPAPGVPLQQLGTVEQPWTAASAASVGGSGSHLGFSAVCWVAGRALHAQLGGEVPLGLVVSAWGGTLLQQWAPTDAVLRECKQSPGQGARFEAMIAPLLRMRFAGVLFYVRARVMAIAARLLVLTSPHYPSAARREQRRRCRLQDVSGTRARGVRMPLSGAHQGMASRLRGT
jgi:sialate O-acetylesterase